MSLKTPWRQVLLRDLGFQSYVGLIPTPDDLTYVIDNNLSSPIIIWGVSLIVTAGTIDADVEINGSGVAGLTGISVDTTLADTPATVGFVCEVGDILTLVLSNNAASENLSFNIKYTQQ